MRVYPPVSKEEAAAYLAAHVQLIWGDKPPFSAEEIDVAAEAMAIVSAIEVPDEVEPLFP